MAGSCTGLVAQQIEIDFRGQVSLVTATDSIPLTAHYAVLHRILLEGGAPLDSVLLDLNGEYRFNGVQVDTAAQPVFVVSVDYSDIAYFTLPIRIYGDEAGSAQPLLVHETTVGEPALHIAQRHVILRPRDDDGAQRVLEIVLIENRGRTTRISPDGIEPVWSMTLPPGITEFRVGAGDISDQAVRADSGRVFVTAPVPPGDRQLLLTYTLARGADGVEIPVDQEVGRFFLLLADTSSSVVPPVIARTGTDSIESFYFARYEGFDVPAGADISVTFSDRVFVPEDYVAFIAIGFGALGLAVLVLWQKRRKLAPTAGSVSASDDSNLRARIEALDRQLAVHSLTDDERARLVAARARLQRDLDDLLAKAPD